MFVYIVYLLYRITYKDYFFKISEIFTPKLFTFVTYINGL